MILNQLWRLKNAEWHFSEITVIVPWVTTLTVSDLCSWLSEWRFLPPTTLVSNTTLIFAYHPTSNILDFTLVNWHEEFWMMARKCRQHAQIVSCSSNLLSRDRQHLNPLYFIFIPLQLLVFSTKTVSINSLPGSGFTLSQYFCNFIHLSRTRWHFAEESLITGCHTAYLKLSHILLVPLCMQLQNKMNSLFQFHHDLVVFGSQELVLATMQRHSPNKTANLCELLPIRVHRYNGNLNL